MQTPRAEFLDVHNEAQLARCGRDKGDVAAKLAPATSAFGKRALIAERQLIKIFAKNRTVRIRPNAGRSRLGEIEMNGRPLLRLPMRLVSVCNVSNSVEKVDMLERVETFFQPIVPDGNFNSISHVMGFDTCCSAQQNLAG